MDNKKASQAERKDGVPGVNIFKSKAHMEEVLLAAKNYSLAAHLQKIHQASEQGTQQSGNKQSKQTLKGDGAQILDQEGNQQQQEAGSSSFFSTKPLDLLDMYIDAKDSVNNWCVARVIDHDIRNNRIYIHFDGWSQRYDETVRTASSRIAPFRKYTTGYTGQSKVALRDFDLNYSYQVMLLNRMQRVNESNFQCFKDANECTQFIRGELYIYFDSLISLVNQPSKSDTQKIFEFATEVFKLCIKWLDLCDQDTIELIRMCQKHNCLFAVDMKAAIATCWYELYDMVHKCVGLCERSNRFLRQQAASIWYPTEFGDPAKAEEQGFVISLAGKFAELGGFDKVLGMFRFGRADEDSKPPMLVLTMGIKT